MIHHSCDRCKRSIDTQDDIRYVVRMEVKACMDFGAGTEDDADRDHLMEIHEILESQEDLENDLIDDSLYQQLRFDLCPSCYRKFLRNPVGKDSAVDIVNFSQN